MAQDKKVKNENENENKNKNERFKIESPHLIICEGRDDEGYLLSYLKNVEMDEKFQVKNCMGKDKIPSFIKGLENAIGIEILQSLIVIRDADEKPKEAIDSIKNALGKNRFAVPSKPCEVAIPKEEEHKVKVGYALFPKFNSEDTPGRLEDLCLKTLNLDGDIIEKIAFSAVNDVEQSGALKHPYKNKLHTCLSLTDDFVGKKIGESAKAKAFDFSAKELEPLKELLLMMLD